MAGSRPGSAASNTGSVLLLNTADVDDDLVVEDLDVEEEEVVLGSGSVESVTGNSGQEVKGSGEMKNSQSEFDGTTDAQGSEGDADGLKGRTFQNKISMMTADGRLPGVGGEDDDESKDGDDGDGLKSEDTSVRGKGATNLVDLINFVSDIDADKEWREKPGLEDPRKHSKSFGDQTLKAKMRRWVYSTEVQGFVVAVICVDVMFLLVGYLDFALVSAPAQKYLAYAVTGIMVGRGKRTASSLPDESRTPAAHPQNLNVCVCFLHPSFVFGFFLAPSSIPSSPSSLRLPPSSSAHYQWRHRGESDPIEHRRSSEPRCRE